jgi:amidophosphoribosyltransferase
VYLSRARAGQRLAEAETEKIDEDCIVVPVPDTAKAAADAFAFRLGIPSVEGLIRNRYVGRTFIQPKDIRGKSAHSKYTPLPSVLAGKRVFLVDDSIVRSTTVRELIKQLYQRGGAKEVHVRVACPPIIAPCFYGIDMSTFKELFAAHYAPPGYNGTPTPAMLARMARDLGVNSLRYLNVDDLGPCIRIDGRRICTGCVTGKQPTPMGSKLMAQARKSKSGGAGRTYERAAATEAGKPGKKRGC